MKRYLPEEIWGEKLHGYSSPVDKKILESVLDAKNKRRKFRFPFWIILPMLLLGGAATLMVSDRSPTQGIVLENNVPNQQKATIAKSENKYPQEKIHSNKSDHNTPDNKKIAGSFDKQPEPENTETAIAENKQKDVLDEFPEIQHYDFALKGLKKKTSYKPASLAGFPSTPSSLSLPPLFSNSEDVLIDDPFVIGKNKIVIPDCPDFSDSKRNWYVEVFGAIDFPSKKLEQNIGKSGFIEQKDSTEKFLMSWSAGFRIGKYISNSWSLKTGLQFSQLNEEFNYHNEQERRITTVITIRSIIRGPGDTLFISDSSQVEVTGVRTKTTYNRYYNLDIPLLVSYEIRNPGLSFSVQGGPIFNISSRFKGDMIDTTGLPFSSSGKDPATQFKSSLGLGLYAGVSVIKAINEDFDIFAEPYYRRYLNNQASEAAPFQQYLSNWGIQFGIRYSLNKGGQRF